MKNWGIAIFIFLFILFSIQFFSQTANSETGDQEELETVLEKCVAYCEKLANSALHFVCEETITEEINHGYIEGSDTIAISGGTIAMRGGSQNIERNFYVYDYQLIKKGENIEETRILLKENGKKKIEKNAQLKTKRFYSRRSVFGPVGLLGKAQQDKYDYSILKEQTLKRRKVYVIEVTPKIKIEGNPNFGRVWVDKEDFSVLKIEIEQESLAGYDKIAQETEKKNMTPHITTTHEYFIEKNGLRFPSKTVCEEIYTARMRRMRLRLSETVIDYDNYKFFLVNVEIKY